MPGGGGDFGGEVGLTALDPLAQGETDEPGHGRLAAGGLGGLFNNRADAAFAVDDEARRVDIAGVFYRGRDVTSAMAKRG